ncbi:hypothetical protein F5J12DRAFT_779972 [Pisolithus orientalis]|uniref:uncharacterized protein n=1 Tax=Pisolithus orientalis TaxID=936130 RepID=UPI002224B2B9|nr:uncharacterized protein F5J12DRAFT_779972 [Pisolithus orientalis]KAI6030964.1 hypothetical protein F5J12DRAFT_779972 [Pisolithus orientalis]
MATQFMLWTSSLLQNLRAPSSVNHRYNYSASFNQGGLSEDSLVSLYNNDRKCWNWELCPPPGSDSPPKQPGPLASELLVESEKLCFEKQVALFLNAIRTAAKSMMLSLSRKPQHQWMADWSRTSLRGSTGYSQKPSLILVDNTPVSLNEITWLSPKVIAKYSKESFKPASYLGKMMDTKAYPTLVDQPWRCYVLGLSITDSELLQLHFYDHSGGAISPSINIHTDTEVFIYILQMHSTYNTSLPFPLSYNAFSSLGVRHPPQCKLTPDSHITQSHPSNQEDPSKQDLLQGFLGRGTVCYIACYNGEYYVIKDYWVEKSEQRTALHEVNMMKLVQDIDRVPKLQHYWVIKNSHVIGYEAVCKANVQQQALKRGVLHRDCSINNTMIEDFANGSHGFLLDWEFAVWVMLQGEYDLGSTYAKGTVPFFSVNILCQLKEAITKSGKTNVPSIQKSTSLTHVFINHPTTIHHTFADDIESLFYIFIWILILYDGPLGHKCQAISHEKTLLGLWSEKAAEDLKIARCAKFTFLNDLSELRLDSEVSQYFQDLIPLANEWSILLGQSLLSGTAVQFSDIISLFDCFLASMPYEKPLEMMNAFQQIIAQHKVLNSSMHLSQENDMDVMSSAIMSSKCLCEECFNSFAEAHPSILKSLSRLPQQDSVIVEGQGQVQVEGLSNWSGLPQKLTDLPNNSVVNPLAPLPTWWKKGGGHSAGQNAKPKSNVAPPPYVPPIVNDPSPADMPPNPVPQSSTAVATPVFHQHPTDSHHFCFSVPAQQPGHIMPPGMEPDLQVLNNPYITSIQGDQVPSNTSHLPTPQPNYQSRFIPHQPPATIPDSCVNPSLDSLLSLRQTSVTTDVCHKSSEKLSSEGSSEEEPESSSNNPSDTEAGKDDNVALQSLQSKDKAQPEGSQHGTVIDVLECNHCTNGHPSVPNRDLLTLVHDLVNEVSQHARAPHNSKKAKDEGPLPSQLRFYKAALITVVIEWNQCGMQFEDGYWPDHKQDMLLGDISTWHSELKLVMLATMPSVFNFIPPSDVAPWGKTRNFAHPTLKEAVIQFYYTRTYQIADKSPESFNNSVPLSCLALVAAMYHCVLDGFAKNSTGEMMPQFSGKAYNSIFHGMMKVMNDILCNPYHGVRLCNQLSQWVKEGCMQLMPMLLFLSYLL